MEEGKQKGQIKTKEKDKIEEYIKNKPNMRGKEKTLV